MIGRKRREASLWGGSRARPRFSRLHGPKFTHSQPGKAYARSTLMLVSGRKGLDKPQITIHSEPGASEESPASLPSVHCAVPSEIATVLALPYGLSTSGRGTEVDLYMARDPL